MFQIKFMWDLKRMRPLLRYVLKWSCVGVISLGHNGWQEPIGVAFEKSQQAPGTVKSQEGSSREIWVDAAAAGTHKQNVVFSSISRSKSSYFLGPNLPNAACFAPIYLGIQATSFLLINLVKPGWWKPKFLTKPAYGLHQTSIIMRLDTFCFLVAHVLPFLTPWNQTPTCLRWFVSCHSTSWNKGNAWYWSTLWVVFEGVL